MTFIASLRLPPSVSSNFLLKSALLALLLLGMGGCQACDDVDESTDVRKEVVRETKQSLCAPEACVIGSKGCDDNGDIIQCEDDGTGCGDWNPTPTAQCPASHWCYLGACTWVDPEPIPAVMKPSKPSLYDLPGPTQAIPSNVVVIPYSAFVSAILYDSYFDAASDNEPVNTAVDLSTIANDPATYGITVQVDEVGEFSGDLFLVVMDGERSHVNPTFLESKRYFFAAMPGLAGVTQWAGAAGTAQFMTSGALGGANCCQAAGVNYPANDIFCGAARPQTPVPVPVCPAAGLPGANDCPSPLSPQPGLQDRLNFWQTLPQDFAALHLDGPLILDPTGQTPQIQLRSNGMPMIGLLDTFDRDHHADLANSSTPGQHGHAEVMQLGVRFHNMSYCQKCEDVLCSEDPSLNPDLLSPEINNNCGSSTNARDPKDPCYSMLVPSEDQTCQTGCNGPCLGGSGAIPGNYCNSTAPGSPMLVAGGPPTATSVCDAPTLPPYCQYVTGTAAQSGECGASKEVQEGVAKIWSEMLGCSGFTGKQPSSDVTCIEGGACQEFGTGDFLCMQCSDGGGCTKTVISTNDQSRYYGGDANDPCGGEENCVFTTARVKTNENQPENKKNATNSSTAQQDKPDPANEPAPQTPTQPQKPSATGEQDIATHCLLGLTDCHIKLPPGRNPEDTPVDSKVEGSTPKSPNKENTQVTQGGVQTKNRPGKPAGDADPVMLSSGSLVVSHTDLSFPGPVRALEFARSYSSRSEQRSILGSNWTHNYNERLSVVTQGNAPSWVPSYCFKYYPMTTCVIFHEADGGQTLFIKNPGDTNELFLPSSGSTDTVKRYFNGWALKRADGHTKIFNEIGSLTDDRDRFGNGFKVEYEDTPVGRAFYRHCHTLSQNNGLKPKTEIITDSREIDPSGTLADLELVQVRKNTSLDERFCRIMSSILADEPLPRVGLEGWDPLTTAIHAPSESTLSDFYLAQFATQNTSGPKHHPYNKLDSDYVNQILGLDALPNVPTGTLRQRPTKVTDDLGRTLTFEYFNDLSQIETYGLLKKVTGPAQLNKVEFSYDRPSDAPARLNESFLMEIKRTDAAPAGQVWKNPGVRTISLEYNWSGKAPEYYGSSKPGHAGTYADFVLDSYLAYYGSMNGCRWSNHDEIRTNQMWVCGIAGGSGGGGGVTAPGLPGGSVVTVCGPNGQEVVGAQSLSMQAFSTSTSNSDPSCAQVRASKMSNNPCFLAELKKDEYISDVADNIVRITRFGTIEVESQYEVDPDERTFDRVTVQRYGGLGNNQYGPQAQSGRASGTWQSDFPEFKLDYVMTKPLGTSNDATQSSGMPSDLLTRYPLEGIPTPPTWEPIDPCHSNYNYDSNQENTNTICGGADEKTIKYRPDCKANYELFNRDEARCDPNRQIGMQLKLPAYFELRPWQELQESAPNPNHPKLYRSRMTCSQIALHHERNPSHNGVLQTFVEADANGPDRWERVQGSRDKLQDDHRRICAWTKVTDRDRDVRYVGMNFRGQALVDAQKVGGKWQVVERLYNADGMLIEQRAPSLAPNQWDPSKGYKTWRYDEIDPAGEGGWNDWTPLWWMRRFNLLEEREYPRTNGTLARGYDWDGQAGSLSEKEIAWRGRLISYEPLYNQPRRITSKVQYAGTNGHVDSQDVVIDYDYQELDPNSDAFFDALATEQNWALRIPVGWRSNTPGNPLRSDWVKKWHVPVNFYNADINADGHQGSPVHLTGPDVPASMKIRGAPVRVTWFGRNGSSEKKVRWIKPAPHGQPAQIWFEDGRRVDYHYWDTTTSASQIPNLTTSSPQYRGLLAKTASYRYGQDDMTLSDGPDGAAGLTSTSRCEKLKAPFQWMLPGGCGSDPDVELANQLGLPQDVRDELISADDGGTYQQDSVSSDTILRYNESGHVRDVENINGQHWTLQRDLDGRVYKVTDAAGGIVEYERDIDGWITKTSVRDGGSLVRQSWMQYDAEGNILTQCQEVTPNGCDTVMGAGLVDFDHTRPANNPDYALQTYRYTPEGLLIKTRDAMGTLAQYTRDARGLITSESVTPQGTGTSRSQSYTYHNTTNELLQVQFGAKTKSYSYDGLGRLVSFNDFEGAVYTTAYNGWGQVTSQRASGQIHHGNLAFADYESRYAYDVFGALDTTLDPQGNKTKLHYNSRHLPRQVDVYPGGSSPPRSQWMTYDGQGELAWSIDNQGNQAIMVTHAKARRQVSASIIKEEVSPGVRGPTTATVTTFDLAGFPDAVSRHGQQGELQQWGYSYNSVGDMIAMTQPDGKITQQTYNMAGWPTQSQEPNSVSANMSVLTTREYNPYGLVTKLREPGLPLAETTYQYNGFGELTERLLPRGQRETMAYDTYGRLERHKTYQANQVIEDLQWQYPTTPGVGYQRKLYWMNAPGGQALLTQHDHDTYGRLLRSESRGLRQANLLGLSHPKVAETIYTYDSSDRLFTERQKITQGASTLSDYETGYAYAAANGAWSMTTSYDGPGSFTITSTQDALGRTGTMSMAATGPHSGVKWPDPIQFKWAGGLYTGRTQPFAFNQADMADPMKESRTFDGLGRLRTLDFRAVNLNTSNQPYASGMDWANAYCLGAWNATCASPLLSVDMKWDVMDRLSSQTQKMRHPVWSSPAQTSLRPEAQRRHDWRGFDYSDRGYLVGEYLSDLDQTSAHAGLSNHNITKASLDALIANPTTPGMKWNWEREEGAGDLQKVVRSDAPANVRWQHVNTSDPQGQNLRKPGHELASVEIEGQGAKAILHDGRGRTTQDMEFEYAWDALDRLVAAKTKGTSSWEEIYYYDAKGRLVQTEQGSQHKTFVYDGAQKIQAFDQAQQLVWRGVWRPGLDELIWWHDVQGNASYLTMTNGRKSIVGLWHEQSGQIKLTREFDATGRVTLWNSEDESLECEEQLAGQRCPSVPAGATTRFGFGWHSAWQSELTGLVQMRQRWYSPELGQFMSHDPLEYVDSQNLYAFASHDPINGWDPFGLANKSATQPKKKCGALCTAGRIGGTILDGAVGMSKEANKASQQRLQQYQQAKAQHRQGKKSPNPLLQVADGFDNLIVGTFWSLVIGASGVPDKADEGGELAGEAAVAAENDNTEEALEKGAKAAGKLGEATIEIAPAGKFRKIGNPKHVIRKVKDTWVIGYPKIENVRPRYLRGRQEKGEFTNSKLRKYKKFMKRDGYRADRPIDVVKIDDRHYIIIDGHHRARAAGAAKIEKVPVKVWKVTEKTKLKLLNQATAISDKSNLRW